MGRRLPGFLTPRQARRRRLLQAFLLLSGATLMLVAGFYLGQKATYSGKGIDPQVYREMEAELPAARKKIHELQAELDVVQTRHAVDREGLEIVRRDIAAQKEQIASLDEGLEFYRSLMAPGEIAQGLSLRVPELVRRELSSTYAFRIVAQQEARKHDLLKGEISVEVFGVAGGEQVSYSIDQLSDDIEQNVMELRFRYFQAIEGELTLPGGFDPEGITVVAKASSPRKAEVSERFAWRIQERFTHVGK